MSVQRMVKSVDFISRPRYMGPKLIITVPKDFEREFKGLIGKYMKFHGEEILGK